MDAVIREFLDNLRTHEHVRLSALTQSDLRIGETAPLIVEAKLLNAKSKVLQCSRVTSRRSAAIMIKSLNPKVKHLSAASRDIFKL